MSKQSVPSNPVESVTGPGITSIHADRHERMLVQRQARPRLLTYQSQPVLTTVCVAMFLLLFALLATIKYREIMPVAGVLETTRGSMKVSSPQPGIIETVSVTPGDYVESGTVLLTVNTSVFDVNGAAYAEQDQQRLLQRRQRLLADRDRLVDQFQAQSGLLEASILQSESRITAVAEDRQLVESRLVLSEGQLSRLARLAENDGLTLFELEREQMRHLELLGQQTSLARQAQDISLESQGLRAQLYKLRMDFDNSRGEIAAKLTELDYQDSLLQRRTSFSLIAHEEGVVSSLVGGPGERISAGEPLVYLQPPDFDLLATILVPGSAVGKLKPGQQTLLRYDSFDYHSYGRYEAEIIAIERSPLDPREHILPLTQVAEPVFRVLVKPRQHYVEGPDIFPLLPGMTLTADFVLNELTFVQFMFKPFLGLQGRLT